MSQPQRVVLDTNCLISALLFVDGRLSWLRRDWQAGRFVPLVSRATVEELLRVLAYPKFQLNRHDRDALLADFLPFTETVTLSDVTDGLPDLRDPDDRIFLQLAVDAKADALVTGDKDLLAVKPLLGEIPVMTPAEFAVYLTR